MCQKGCCRRCLLYVGTYPKKVIYTIYLVLLVYGVVTLLIALIDKLVDARTSNTIFFIGLAIGFVSIVNSWLGMYGTIVDGKNLVFASSILLFVTCVIQISVIMSQMTLPQEDSKELEKDLNRLFEKRDPESVNDFREIEISYGCCGVMGYGDYNDKFNISVRGYPAVCCGESSGKCTEPTAEGCYSTILYVNHWNDVVKAAVYLSSSAIKFVSSICISILTFWGDKLLETERIDNQ